jgi:hypothetical protein
MVLIISDTIIPLMIVVLAAAKVNVVPTVFPEEEANEDVTPIVYVPDKLIAEFADNVIVVPVALATVVPPNGIPLPEIAFVAM